MFQVFDNNKPADFAGYPIMREHWWKTSRFDTFEAAQAYAKLWLGAYYYSPLLLNTPYDYNGCGDIIEIREVSDGQSS